MSDDNDVKRDFECFMIARHVWSESEDFFDMSFDQYLNLAIEEFKEHTVEFVDGTAIDVSPLTDVDNVETYAIYLRARRFMEWVK